MLEHPTRVLPDLRMDFAASAGPPSAGGVQPTSLATWTIAEAIRAILAAPQIKGV
jgi:hypothetical protein